MTTKVFPGIPESASDARHFTGEVLASMGCANIDAAQMIVSELVTNSVRHSLSARDGWIGVSVTAQAGDHAVIIVADDGPADGKAPAVPAECPPLGESGMGLWIVSRMSEFTVGAPGLCWARLPWTAPVVPDPALAGDLAGDVFAIAGLGATS